MSLSTIGSLRKAHVRIPDEKFDETCGGLIALRSFAIRREAHAYARKCNPDGSWWKYYLDVERFLALRAARIEVRREVNDHLP